MKSPQQSQATQATVEQLQQEVELLHQQYDETVSKLQQARVATEECRQQLQAARALNQELASSLEARRPAG